jgi:hypothetical protein
MEVLPMLRPRLFLSSMCSLALLGLALGLAPQAAIAKEESKIQILLLPPGPGNGNGNGLAKGNGPIGDVRSFLQGDSAILQLHVRGLEPGVEHTLLALLDETDPDPLVLAHFTTDPNGQFNDTFDLTKGDAIEAPVDPRGKYLVVSDGAEDVLAGWLYGAPEDDGPMTKVKELTELAPDETADPSGTASAGYDMRPNGKGSLDVMMRGVPAGDYDIYVDGVMVETLTPTPGGTGRASFLTHPSKGKGSGKAVGHNKRGPLDFDPRRKLIELKQGAQVYFSGPMIAQIEGLNACSPSETSLALTLPAGSGTAVLEIEADCETALALDASGLAAGTYDLLVDGVDVGDVVVADDGIAAARFDPTPDEAGELLLDFALSGASTVELVAQP